MAFSPKFFVGISNTLNKIQENPLYFLHVWSSILFFSLTLPPILRRTTLVIMHFLALVLSILPSFPSLAPVIFVIETIFQGFSSFTQCTSFIFKTTEVTLFFLWIKMTDCTKCSFQETSKCSTLCPKGMFPCFLTCVNPQPLIHEADIKGLWSDIFPFRCFVLWVKWNLIEAVKEHFCSIYFSV